MTSYLELMEKEQKNWLEKEEKYKEEVKVLMENVGNAKKDIISAQDAVGELEGNLVTFW